MLLLALFAISATAQDTIQVNQNKPKEAAPSFVAAKDMPSGIVFLPAPPSPTDPEFVRDSIFYVKGKAERLTTRLDTALADVSTSVAYYMKRFSPAVNRKLSKKSHPILAQLMAGTINDVRASISESKEKFARQRPYSYFNEPTPDPKNEAYSPYASYPSGHSVRAWSLALLLTVIDPEHSNEIARIGYDICHSRVVLGYHYQSDIEAGMLSASMAFSRLLADSAYQDCLQRAKIEFSEKQSKPNFKKKMKLEKKKKGKNIAAPKKHKQK